MMRSIFAVAIWLLLTATPAFAAQKGPKGGHQAKPPAVSKTHARISVKTTVKSPKVKAPKAMSPKASSPKVKTTKVKTKVKIARNTSAPPTGTLSPTQQKLQRNTNLAAKLQGRLPPGTDLMAASAGFRNLGQFVATVNASHNHGLSFVELKRRIVGQGMSLGQATKDLRR